MILVVHRKTNKVVLYLDKPLPAKGKCSLKFHDEVLENKINPANAVFDSNFVYIEVEPNQRFLDLKVGDEVHFDLKSEVRVDD